MPARTPRTALSFATLLSLVAAPLALGFTAPVSANPGGTGLVISEAYGGGGNSGAAYRADFVELYNPTSSAITMTNWSIQYRSSGSTGAASGTTPISGTVPARGYFLVRQATGAGTTLPDLPTADVTGSIAMSGTAFQVWLANTTAPQTPPAGNVTGIPSPNPAIIDFLGVGATSYEGTAAAPGTGNPTSANRVDTAGVQSPPTDTDQNGVDFKTLAPTPKNSSSRFPELVKPPLVISEVFTQGTDGGEFGDDFVEIYNSGTAAVDLGTVTYSVSGGPSTALTGTLAAGAYVVLSLALDDANGSVQLRWTQDDSSIDLVGWGTGAHEGAAAAPAGTATQSAQRNQDNDDTNVNGTDFTAQTPTRGVGYEPPALPLTSIASIQGNGASTPLAGQTVRTEGVVTASFGNTSEDWQGFYLQTGGTPDTPGASDGLFVASGTLTAPAVGSSVSVTGAASETFGLTTLTVARASDIDPVSPAPAIVAQSMLPGSDCSVAQDGTTDCLTGSALAAAREKHESELFLPTAPFTVSDSYDGSPWANSSSSNFGEIGLAANSTKPLYLPIDLAHPVEDAQRFASLRAFNDAHMVTLDDGSNRSWSGTANTGSAFPWMTANYTVRVGAGATFHQPFVYDFRFGKWRLQPQTAVAPGSTGQTKVSFAQNRPAQPDDVGGNVKIATFNMLNYFAHAAQDWDDLPDDSIGQNRFCSYYSDRQGNRITARECTWKDLRNNPPSTLPDIGPRGAATEANLLRQEGKEVAAINTMAADVLSLEEVENPVKLGYADRDLPLKRLVDALNADWAVRHPGDANTTPRWAYVPSPRTEAQPTIAEQDAIRNAYIYNPRVLATVGRSQILVNSPAMRNAREPLAQAFRHMDGSRDDGFIVIANHFKSKSEPEDLSTVAGTDNDDQGKGAGYYNGDRIRQARALNEFANSVAEDKGIPAVFMTGDYNAYGAEDPVRVLEAAGWANLEPTNGESSYSFGGLAGSLDHVFANAAARTMVVGQTIWPINANESVYYEYSRFNYNVANLFDGTTPFRSSDHNPEIVGINAPINPEPPSVDTVQVLASNDFHGRLLDDPASASAGAASMAEAVKGLRADNENTVFAMAGDIVGASTFESFIQNDKPTIDAMNEAGLEVSAAGNHEFDQGYDDLMQRIMAEYDATGNPEGGANWPYIAANVRLGDENGPYALETDREDGHFAHSNGATWWKEFETLNGDDGINVGFVGAVTEDLDSLVAPDAIEGLAITSIVDEVNAAAEDLKLDGCGGEPCDVVVELVHEGAPSPSCATIQTDSDSTFGRIVHEASADIDAIISGHTHLKYNCKVDVVGKSLDRPVVSAGQYGSYLNQLEFDFEPGTDTLVRIRQHVLAMKDYDDDAATKAIVDDAVELAAIKGAVELGQVSGPFKRARRTDPASGVVENRGGESTLGNQVAEIQRWRTGADIGVMNPGGLRDDLIGTSDGAGPVTYREAANVQPFANTLVTVDLTGEQLELLLEQQWQRDPDGNIPSRPFLRLGTSKGFTWSEDSTRPEGERITGMWLEGVAIDPTDTYTVAANSFIASGGDNFRALTLGSNKQDSGFTDLQATVDFLAEFASSEPLAVDFSQHAVGAQVPAGPFVAGDLVTIPVNSLSMTGAGDLSDTSVWAALGDTALGTFPVKTELPTTPYDTPGTTTVTFNLPAGLSGGTHWLTLTGASIGTVAKLPLTVTDTRADSTVSGTAADITWGQAGSVDVTVAPATATGKVELFDGATRIGEGTLMGDATSIAIAAEALAVGDHSLTLKYLGDAGTKPSQGTVGVTVVKATSTVSGTAPDITWGDAGSVSVTVSPSAASGSVEVYDGATKLGEATLTGGQASVALPAKSLSVGAHALTVTYLGDGDHTASQATVSVTVVKAPSDVSGTAARIQWGKAGSVTVAVVPSEATGQVAVFHGATRLGGAVLSNATASISLPARSLPVGTHTLTLRYYGDGQHRPDDGTVTITVTKGKG